jgi:hypothetical protein
VTPLILGVDSGLDGAFVWMREGRVLHHVLTRAIVTDGRIDTVGLEQHHDSARDKCEPWVPRIAYLEEPFNNAISGGASTSGYTDQCKRWGRLQGWLESWGYEVKGVQAKTWQREVLDLARFEVRTEKACAPRLAEGWTLKPTTISGDSAWSLRHGGNVSIYKRHEGQKRADAIASLSFTRADCTVSTKSVISHDTKAASVAYAREHFPGVALVPPRCKNPHDGLADAICIAAWASKQLNKET